MRYETWTGVELIWSNVMHSFIWHTSPFHPSSSQNTRWDNDEDIKLRKETKRKPVALSHSEDTCCPLSLIFSVILVDILQGVERSGYVYSIIPQCWHLKVLQYIAASFHLTSVNTANINTVQYTKPHKQYEIPTIPAPVISIMLLLHSNIMAAFVHSHSNLFTAVCSGLPI